MQKPELKRLSASILTSAVLGLGSMAFVSTAAATTSPDTGANAVSVAATDTIERGHRKAHHRGHGKRAHYFGHQRMGKAAMLVPGYGPVPKDVVESLSLNAEQVALLDDAKSFISERREAQREKFAKAKGERSARTITTPLDPHAAVKWHEERFTAMQQARTEGMQKWLAVWDSLEPAQQQILSDYVVNRSEQRAQRKAEHKEKRAARKAEKS